MSLDFRLKYAPYLSKKFTQYFCQILSLLLLFWILISLKGPFLHFLNLSLENLFTSEFLYVLFNLFLFGASLILLYFGTSFLSLIVLNILGITIGIFISLFELNKIFSLKTFDVIVNNFNLVIDREFKFRGEGEILNETTLNQNWVPQELKKELRYCSLEYIEQDILYKLNLEKKKLKNKSSELNKFLKFKIKHPFLHDEVSCEHRVAEEIYCEKCENDYLKKIKTFRDFLFIYKNYKKFKRENFENEKIFNPNDYDRKRKYKENRENDENDENDEKFNKTEETYESYSQSFATRNLNHQMLNDLDFFELSKDFSIEQLKEKRNYLLKRNHPDKVSTMDKDIIELAKNKTQIINNTYNRLKKLKKIN
tara:strand:- start:198 stop:1298 length:1101 start_codon:yes stop_codon:yes gene_type:complete